MKWISGAAGVAIVMSVAMIREGKVATSMKAENREALILYGLLICSLSCIWLVTHGFTVLLRSSGKKAPPESDAS